MPRFLATFCCLYLLFTPSTYAGTVGDSARQAVMSHPEMLLEITKRDLEYTALAQAESSFLPKLSLSLGIGREDSNNSSTRARSGSSSEMERRESSLSLSQMLFDGFDTHWRVESQQVAIDAARSALLYAASTLALEAIDSHLMLVQVKQQLGYHFQNLQAHEAIAKNTAARVKSGKDDRTKVTQIQARLSLSKANVEQAKNALQREQSRYRELVGQDPGDDLHPASSQWSLPPSLSDFLQQIELDNPLMQARKEQQHAAELLAKASDSSYYPALSFESGASWNDNLDGISGRNSDAFAMLRLRYELYAGGQKSASRQQARLQRQQSAYALDVSRRALRRDAESVWYLHQSNTRREALLLDYVAASLQTKEAYAKQFGIGQRSLIDLLDAENELLAARTALAAAQQQLAFSHYQMLAFNGQLLAALLVSLPEHAE